MMCRAAFTLIAITATLLLMNGALALQWSEIMFNPLGNDNGKEYVELIGTEDLTNCAIYDSASSDKLLLHHLGLAGNDIILIMENDSEVLPAGRDATAYMVGSAIGNGLGNTAETLNITCGNATLLSTSYNVSLLPGYKEGESIVFLTNAWQIGPMNGTPGVKDTLPVSGTNQTNSSSNNQSNQSSTTTPPITKPNSGGNIFCNASLAITVSETAAAPGDHLLFTIISDDYAEYEAFADNKSIAAGDTLTTREHSVVVPEGELLRIQALAHTCGGRQRASRTITILHTAAADTEVNTTNETAPPMAEENATVHEALRAVDSITPPPRQETVIAKAAPAQATGAVVLDENRSAVPWLCAFGIITLLVSAGVFFKIRDGK